MIKTYMETPAYTHNASNQRLRSLSFSSKTETKHPVQLIKRKSLDIQDTYFGTDNLRGAQNSDVVGYDNPVCNEDAESGHTNHEDVCDNPTADNEESGIYKSNSAELRPTVELKDNINSTSNGNKNEIKKEENFPKKYGSTSVSVKPALNENDAKTGKINHVVQIEQFVNQDDFEKKNIQETACQALGQLLFPFLIAGLGNVAAGLVLADIQSWDVFIDLPQLIILVPALIGLKGNVEMTLASRLSTHANLGHMDNKGDRRDMIIGNMALVQCQAATVGFIAPLIAVLLSMITSDSQSTLTFHKWLLLSSSSVITANIANLFLGSVMCIVVLCSRKYNINPDNIATPIAASLGDFTTLFLLAHISRYLFNNSDMPAIQNALLVILLMFIPLWAYIARSNRFTRSVILTGWFPILGAMLLQNSGGLIMEQALDQFKRIAAFQPVINGIAGNMVAIQSSRMSTYLHQNTKKKKLPESDPKACIFPFMTFFSRKSPHSSMARLLLVLSVPSHILFILVIKVVRGQFELTPLFFLVYLSAAVIQVSILLHLAYCLVHWIWKRGFNPDNTAIPFLTAFADLIGSALLAAAFVTLYHLGDPNAFAESNTSDLNSNTTLKTTTVF